MGNAAEDEAGWAGLGGSGGLASTAADSVRKPVPVLPAAHDESSLMTVQGRPLSLGTRVLISFPGASLVLAAVLRLSFRIQM